MNIRSLLIASRRHKHLFLSRDEMNASVFFNSNYYYYYYYYSYYYYYYYLQLSCHSMAVVLTLIQTKQVRINIHKRNNTKTQYKQYKTQ